MFDISKLLFKFISLILGLDTTENFPPPLSAKDEAEYFRRMREEDSFKNVVFRDIFAREGAELCIACDRVTPDIRN